MAAEMFNTHDAKSKLSQLIRRAEEGEEVILARNGRPVAKLVPWRRSVNRIPGAWAGRVHYRSDIVASDEDVIAEFDLSASSDIEPS